MKTGTKNTRRNNGDKAAGVPPILTQDQIRLLSQRLCHDDPEKAAVLLVLATDMNNRQDEDGAKHFPFWAVRQVAYSQLGNDQIDVQAEEYRLELLGTQKGGDR